MAGKALPWKVEADALLRLRSWEDPELRLGVGVQRLWGLSGFDRREHRALFSLAWDLVAAVRKAGWAGVAPCLEAGHGWLVSGGPKCGCICNRLGQGYISSVPTGGFGWRLVAFQPPAVSPPAAVPGLPLEGC